MASRFGLPELKALASGKIHCVNSTAKGEIAYARYVYGHTTAEDGGVRAPVAQFWATRSHVLRSEAEEEFRGLCLEFPQFGYDVLSEFFYFSFFSLIICVFGGEGEFGRVLVFADGWAIARVLDEKLKRDSREKMQPQAGSGRKRQRSSLA